MRGTRWWGPSIVGALWAWSSRRAYPITSVHAGRRAECFVGPRGPAGSRGLIPALLSTTPLGATQPAWRAAPALHQLSTSAATAADVRNPVGDDQSSWVLRTTPVWCCLWGVVARHETSSPAIVGPREAQDECSVEVSVRPPPAGPSASIRTGGHPPPSPRGSPTGASWSCGTGPMRAGTASRLPLCGCLASGRGRRAPRCA
jgi:hypothetical protein